LADYIQIDTNWRRSMPSLDRPVSTPPITQARMGGAGLRAFDAIAREWRLTPRERLSILRVPETTYRRWRSAALAGGDVAVDQATLERLSYILGIYKDLNILLPQDPAEWLRNPNAHTLFGGRPALERMMSGLVADLFLVRQYLDARCAG
jgi:hypothetical protein